MKKIKFKEAGKWSDHPQDPIFSVVKGEEKIVSDDLANVAVKAGKADYVKEKVKAKPDSDAEAKAKADAEAKAEAKAKADAEAKAKNPAHEDKSKAEHK